MFKKQTVFDKANEVVNLNGAYNTKYFSSTFVSVGFIYVYFLPIYFSVMFSIVCIDPSVL